MSKRQEQTVKDVLNLHKEMNELSVDKINEMAPQVQDKEPEVKLSMKEIARMEGVPYIEPIRKLKAIGSLPEKWRKQHARDWEYVKGIFENEVSRGEPIEFSFCKWPGDPDCIWRVPSNTPVYVPRMIAKHLSGEKDEVTGMQAMQYHQFDHIQKVDSQMRKDDFTHQFAVIGTTSRGKFRAIGAFS